MDKVPVMPIHSKSSRSKITWAEKRFDDLKREIEQFRLLDPYEQVIEPHPDQPSHVVHKIKLTRDLPESLTHITNEIVQSLRAALDHAVYAIAVATQSPQTKNAAFPFAGSAENMVSALERCKDVPPPIHPLFCKFQPYPGGDDLLWALNALSNADKHKLLIPIGSGVFRTLASVRGIGYFDMPNPHVWDSAKNEMIIITLGPDTKFDYKFDFGFFVAFGEIKGVLAKKSLERCTPWEAKSIASCWLSKRSPSASNSFPR